MSAATRRLANLRTIWGALLAASLVEAALPRVLPPPPASALPSFFPAVLGVVAAAIAVMSFWLPGFTTRTAFERYRGRVVEDVAAREEGGYRAENARRRVLRLDDAAVAQVMAVGQMRAVLAMALSNSIVLFGLVLERTGFSALASAPFSAAGVLLIALRFPTLANLFAAVARAVDAEVEIDDASG
ncbi:MAG TPA: hypothetical protein VHB21_03875 [Minicystis sp.]|nr:hypothetical protein [Minicystis sp.]